MLIMLPCLTGHLFTFSVLDADVYTSNFLENWGTISKARKPIIAAVSGYAVRPRPHETQANAYAYADSSVVVVNLR